jgi:pimeloyl-ACP methyl ester carboxylesterase
MARDEALKRTRAAARLAIDATTALADLVEAMHQRISPLEGWGPAAAGRTTGITGLVYRSVRGTTRLVGGRVDALLGALAPLILRADSAGAFGEPAGREALVSALNGIAGDHLAETANPLAIPMSFRHQASQAGNEIVVLIHGLCMNDLQWKRAGHDHGEALARQAGLTPVYLRYNTGMRIGSNGRLLAAEMQRLVDGWPKPVDRIVLLGHSMGGLVARSAMHFAGEARLGWPAKVTDLACLGSPHQGAPLERIGDWVETALGAIPYTAPLAKLGGLRSAGIVDLRHGAIREDGAHVPLPDGCRSFAIAGSIGGKPEGLGGRVLGDGLVPVRSALGEHKDAALALRFPRRRQAVAWKTGHLELLGSAEVFGILQGWLGNSRR